ncbi:hypothetical protein FLONG3_2585 [Fusarium longipes]|uniref:Uncharacterized protein n=1 Tax=Fusarium longipes TaxID=694270 RepID=A0A395T3P6_9HYPO|nr:hypothetical protein FLONG3_2585 [Fusarium longipes]
MLGCIERHSTATDGGIAAARGRTENISALLTFTFSPHVILQQYILSVSGSSKMRLIEAEVLIKTKRISFKDFYGDLPEYSILSHTWEADGEVTYQECNTKGSKLKTGYEKIIKTCELAIADNVEYVWVDTCCIDKSSSAELTEAINSMFLWYQKAKFCYVYLVDKVEQFPLASCRWFTRGWTLQELIAPESISFYNHAWEFIGSKRSLMHHLSTITSIDEDILRHITPISSACIAKRLSWAANRTTSRVEDMAYCLLGICNINMPMLYGEGENAFRRLQEEIIKTTYDLSLLAWTPPVPTTEEYCGFLAPSVKHFATCSRMFSVASSILDEGEISISNKGLRLRARVYLVDYSELERPGLEDVSYRYVLELDCMTPGYDGEFLTIPMRKIGPNAFVRARGYEENAVRRRSTAPVCFCLVPAIAGGSVFHTVTLLTTLPERTIHRSPSQENHSDLVSFSRFTMVTIELPQDIAILSSTESPNKFWDMEDSVFFGPYGSYSNWGAFILDTNTLFLCFWHKGNTEWALKGTLLDMKSAGVYALWKDLFLSSEQLGYQQPLVQRFLNNAQGEMKTSIETQSEGRKIRLSFTVWRKDNPSLCSGPRWRVVFREDVIG